MNISNIDKNFLRQTTDGVDLKFIDAKSDPLEVYGFPWFKEERAYCRINQGKLSKVSAGIRELVFNTSGGAIRFRTNSTSIGLNVTLDGLHDMSDMPKSGSSGFDLFAGYDKNNCFVNNARPNPKEEEFSRLLTTKLSGNMQDYTIYFPLYNAVKDVQIGIMPEAEIAAPTPFAIERPILFYGSSITQGGCASRPGNAYTHIVARRLNANFINWGFSGNAKGETIMAETIVELDLSAVVMDYDGNAPNPEHLLKTHEAFFKVIRKAKSCIPIIILSRPNFYGSIDDRKRRDVIRQTYKNAVKRNDQHCYFIDGEILFGNSERDICTVDGGHPNDIGFLRMADNITPILKNIGL